jgi:phage terminase small subunit
MPKKPKLTDRQARFVQEYLIDLNATQAAIRAGFAAGSANRRAYKLLQDPRVQALVQVGRDKAAKRAEITLDQVVAEAAKIGFANMQDYLSVGNDGQPSLDWSKLSREQAAALGEVTVDTFTQGQGEDAKDVRRVKFKLADKLQALIALGKHLGGFGSKIEVTGAGGAPFEMRAILTDAELSRDERSALREMLSRRTGKSGPRRRGVG